jgi:hypothetical protein
MKIKMIGIRRRSILMNNFTIFNIFAKKHFTKIMCNKKPNPKNESWATIMEAIIFNRISPFNIKCFKTVFAKNVLIIVTKINEPKWVKIAF